MCALNVNSESRGKAYSSLHLGLSLSVIARRAVRPDAAIQGNRPTALDCFAALRRLAMTEARNLNANRYMLRSNTGFYGHTGAICG